MSSKKDKTPKPPKSKVVCVAVNAFLRAVDVQLATTFVVDIPCSQYKKMVSKIAKKYPRSKSLKTAQKLVLAGVACHGNVVTNVATMRRKIARIACTEKGGKVRVTKKNVYKGKYPIPRGFVLPRLWDRSWTPSKARKQGWIKDVYYDWLMPVKRVPPQGNLTATTDDDATLSTVYTTAGAAAPTAKPKPRPRPRPLRPLRVPLKDADDEDDEIQKPLRVPLEGADDEDEEIQKPRPRPLKPTPKPEDDDAADDADDADDDKDDGDVKPDNDDDKDDDDDKKETNPPPPTPTPTPTDDGDPANDVPPKHAQSGIARFFKNNWVWIISAVTGLLVIFLIWRWWRHRSKTVSTESIDRAFDTAQPPSNGPQEQFPMQEQIPSCSANMPNTTQLMRDLQGYDYGQGTDGYGGYGEAQGQSTSRGRR